jgi:hypothetical protein
MHPQLENLALVAEALERVPGSFVFAVASVLPLFLDEPLRSDLRPTDDTDVVVSVLHYVQWMSLRDALVEAGFRERADAQQTRQILFHLGGLAVDFIPARLTEFGTQNEWLALGFDLAETFELRVGLTVRSVPAACWLATKVLAMQSRGRRDPLMSKDLEDIIVLLSECSGVVELVERAPSEVRAFVGAMFRGWREDRTIWHAMDDLTIGTPGRSRFEAARAALAALSAY